MPKATDWIYKNEGQSFSALLNSIRRINFVPDIMSFITQPNKQNKKSTTMLKPGY